MKSAREVLNGLIFKNYQDRTGACTCNKNIEFWSKIVSFAYICKNCLNLFLRHREKVRPKLNSSDISTQVYQFSCKGIFWCREFC